MRILLHKSKSNQAGRPVCARPFAPEEDCRLRDDLARWSAGRADGGQRRVVRALAEVAVDRTKTAVGHHRACSVYNGFRNGRYGSSGRFQGRHRRARWSRRCRRASGVDVLQNYGMDAAGMAHLQANRAKKRSNGDLI